MKKNEFDFDRESYLKKFYGVNEKYLKYEELEYDDETGAPKYTPDNAERTILIKKKDTNSRCNFMLAKLQHLYNVANDGVGGDLRFIGILNDIQEIAGKIISIKEGLV